MFSRILAITTRTCRRSIYNFKAFSPANTYYFSTTPDSTQGALLK